VVEDGVDAFRRDLADGGRHVSVVVHRDDVKVAQAVVTARSVGTDRRDDSDQVIAGHERERRLVVVAAPAHLLLGEGHVGGLHADHRLPGGGRRDRSGPRQAFRLHHAGQHDLGELLLFHVRSSTPSRCAVS